jgi:glutathione S-transferase
MKLYGFPGSPNTWKVRAFAHHIGVPIDLQLVDLTKGEQRQPGFLAINPTGRTPALVDGDFKLWESTAILQYIGDKKPGPYWPADAKTRADIMRWQSWQLQHWARACEPLLFERVVKSFFNLGAPDAKAVAAAEHAFHTEAKVLNAHLGKHSQLAADCLTLADFSVGAYLFHYEAAQMPLAEYGNIKRWFGALAALPCWTATAPPKR